MANVAFSYRSNSLNAYYAPGGAKSRQVAPTAPTIVSSNGTGVIGGSYLDMDQGSMGRRGLMWNGKGNIPTTNKFSVLLRFAFGVYPASHGLWSMAPMGYSYVGASNGLASSNQIYQEAENYASGADILVNASWMVATVGQYYDVVWVYDLSSTSGVNDFFIDGVSQNPVNPTGTWPNPRFTDGLMILMGMSSNQGSDLSRIKVNEMVIFDDVIVPSAWGLTGQSRSSFVTASALDGDAYTDPGPSNVAVGTSYIYAGTTENGSYVPPASIDPGQGNVLSGVGYEISGVNKTGSYTPPPSVDPGQANVRQGTAYEIAGVNKTGTLDLPSQANVRQGVVYDNSTKTGTYAPTIPQPSDVRQGVAFTGGPGTLDLPATTDVRSGVAYDGSSKIGTYTVTCNYPLTRNVRAGTVYGAGTGSLQLPATGDVRQGVAYDDGSILGTLAPVHSEIAVAVNDDTINVGV